MTDSPRADKWLSDQQAANRIGALPAYAVFRHKLNLWDYIWRPGMFRLVVSPDHYFFLAYGGLIQVPHGSAPVVETNYLEFLQAEALSTGGVRGVTVGDIIMPAAGQGPARGLAPEVTGWPEAFEPSEETLQTVREWARAAGIDRREDGAA